MGLTPVEIVLYGILGASALLLVLMVLWHFSRITRRQVEAWRAARQRKPDELLQLRTENSRLQAEHMMMMRRLERTLEEARTFAARKEAEASRAINRAGFLEEELAAARRKIKAHEQSIVALGRQITALQEEMNDARNKAERFYTWRSELELRLQERKQELEKLQHELFLRADALDKAQRKLEKLQLQLKETDAQRRNALQAQRQLSRQNEELQRQLMQRDDALREMEERLNREHNRFLQEKMKMQERITELSVKLAAREAELAAASTAADVSGDASKAEEAEKRRISA